jgi:hypothetical protein
MPGVENNIKLFYLYYLAYIAEKTSLAGRIISVYTLPYMYTFYTTNSVKKLYRF